MYAEDLRGFEYRQLPWGDLIYGSKAEIQALGIAEGLAFPGEIGGPKRSLRVRDPRGLVAVVEGRDGDRYYVSIKMQREDRPDLQQQWESFCEGVHKRRSCVHDEYRGSASALIAAGLVRDGQLPGQSGMRKVRVTIDADGMVVGGPRNANLPGTAFVPGARTIEKCGKATFTVFVRVTEEECARRQRNEQVAISAWERRMAALPRPLPLTVQTGVSRSQRPSHLRLVWSAPA